jgi:hypothetical protein
VVTGLTENTMYHFAMKTSDEASNWSGLSNADSSKTRLSNYNTWSTTYGDNGCSRWRRHCCRRESVYG